MTERPIIETERLVLRRPEARDWEAWAGFACSDRARYVGGPWTRPGAWRAYCLEIGHWKLRGYGSFALTLKGADAVLGLAGPWYPEGWPEKEIGWILLDPEAEGNGYAFEAALAARAYAFNSLGWRAAVSYIDPDNARSIALARRLGATLDPSAKRPDPDDLVFRHPAPEAQA